MTDTITLVNASPSSTVTIVDGDNITIDISANVTLTGANSENTVKRNRRTITSSTTLTETDGVVFVDASTNAINITLPTADDTTNIEYKIRVVDLSNPAIILPASGQTIENELSLPFLGVPESYTLNWDGNTWRIT